jgi:hypothetical protein
MTLPFRGRHPDPESTHDRARALISAELTERLPAEDATWLAHHLEACGECRREQEAFTADHELLQGLRTANPEPPRDLWARTAAAIEREAGSRGRGPAGAGARSNRRMAWRGPLATASGALVLLVVVGLAYRQLNQVTPQPSHDVAVASPPAPPPPQPTPLAVAAGDVGWVRPAADGRWELVISKVDEVCPTARKGCQPLGQDTPSRTVDLGGSPTGVTLSPKQDQLVVQSSGKGSAQPDKVYVVPLPSSGPGQTEPPASEPPATATPPASVSPSKSPVIVIPSATPGSTPSGAIEIASGVTVVGEAAYSTDGWLAFSARPTDGSSGPDLYLWHVGDKAATQVTTDHRTFFSGWLGNQVLASQVLVPAVAPHGSAASSAEPAATAGSSPLVSGSPAASALPEAFHPVSFLLDPVTGVRSDLTQPDVWLPVVDPRHKVTAYWSGTLVPTADGLDWQLGEGQLVVDRWVEPGSAPSPSKPAAASSGPSTEPTADPSASSSTAPLEVVGPSGSPVSLDVGTVAVFKALFDPDGTRLAVWAADDPIADVGRLHLLVIDPETGQIDPALRPLAGEPALRRFSIDRGRLAWVSPSGQNGQESAVLVLGWQGRNFGEIKTASAKDLFIVR